jgi:hypothetical protein
LKPPVYFGSKSFLREIFLSGSTSRCFKSKPDVSGRCFARLRMANHRVGVLNFPRPGLQKIARIRSRRRLIADRLCVFSVLLCGVMLLGETHREAPAQAELRPTFAGASLAGQKHQSCRAVSASAFRSFIAALRLSFTRPLSSIPIHFTQTRSPTFTTSSTLFTRKSASSEM